ncbi:hypothetical protein [Devosia sediminis]|uniref:Uncharacterized protein n=1 Tax=Devosia sediminis TaxID=2798801 RepID=A0A934J160_9HYPH|nr:hypothetical protein [Devosia sediminis]MBJ3787046.1 hypothetical protein [Devosia sediminis]
MLERRTFPVRPGLRLLVGVTGGLAAASFTMVALGGEPYAPVPLAPKEAVLPPADLVEAAATLLQASRSDDRPAIGAMLAPRLTLIDGALELGLPRRTEEIGPFETIDLALTALADNIGGIYEQPFDGSDVTPFAVAAERDFIIAAIIDGQAWGRDPLLDGAICTYAYRGFDRAAVIALGEHLDIQTSSVFYVEAPVAALVRPSHAARAASMLQADLLYGLDYDTDAPGGWIAVHLPDGGSGFLNFENVAISKPYASGICFTRDASGSWKMSAQTATNL